MVFRVDMCKTTCRYVMRLIALLVFSELLPDFYDFSFRFKVTSRSEAGEHYTIELFLSRGLQFRCYYPTPSNIVLN